MAAEITRETGRCIVVGAGVAGLVAARALTGAGVPTVVFDKGRGVGGRMATRRVDDPGGGPAGVWDHGAQFFTAADDEFAAQAADWTARGIAAVWSDGFPGDAEDPRPCYRGISGMTDLPKDLARGLDVRLSATVVAVRRGTRAWTVETADGGRHAAEALVLTPPAPQALALLDAGSTTLDEAFRLSIEEITYDSCVAVLVRLDGPSAVPPPGGIRLSGEPLAWIADNHRKGISPDAFTVTLHAGPEFSRRHAGADDAAADALLEAARPWLGARATFRQVHYWRYSRPAACHAEPCAALPGGGAPAVLCGDGFGGARVEGAARSGRAAAERLLAARGSWGGRT